MSSSAQSNLFGGKRLQMTESIKLTIESLKAYGPKHKHWRVAWSGGKDSTALLTLVVWLMESKQIPRPQTFEVLYADTRMELLPLWLSAAEVRSELEERGIPVRTVMAPMDKRMLVYILGRGVPPPNNNTMRWCTRQIKVDPMTAELESQLKQKGEKVLMLTGVRQGESAVRDNRITMSCTRDGGECGQGWYQQTLPDALCDTLAPILHWRVCHIWEWLRHWAPMAEYGDWTTELLAEAYGGKEAEEKNARTGCTGCPLTDKDTALDNLILKPSWAYLAPLKGIRPIFRRLRLPENRIRKMGGETRNDGSLVENQQRMGPITLEARLQALDDVLAIQRQVNDMARAQGRPTVDMLDAAEEARIRELVAAKTWPDKWTGDEPLATVPMDRILPGGAVQPLLFAPSELMKTLKPGGAK